VADLLDRVQQYFDIGLREPSRNVRADIDALIAGLEDGSFRAASRHADGTWVVDPRVKAGILVGFRVGRIASMGRPDDVLAFSDKDTFPAQRPAFEERGIRIVPGGSSVRAGAYLGRNVTCMPPMFVNVGAYIDDGTMVDSHALVGSCAQIGKNVHLSAGVQIGGVLEPVGARPVVVENDVLIGGNCGVYEGTLVRERAVLGAGTILTGSIPVYDLVRDQVYRATAERPLEIPANAVVVPGSRPVGGAFAARNGLHMACALIVKYRDEKTDLRAALEGDLRG
jgi:2,3,4,5-tetrahydropyridine-2-carboxylate N-succinyltransferase